MRVFLPIRVGGDLRGPLSMSAGVSRLRFLKRIWTFPVFPNDFELVVRQLDADYSMDGGEGLKRGAAKSSELVSHAEHSFAAGSQDGKSGNKSLAQAEK